jgi:hypothetical protein
MQNPTQRGFTKGSPPMHAALPVEEAYRILTDEKQNGQNNRTCFLPILYSFPHLVQAFNNSPRFVLNSRVVHTPEQM